MNKAGLGFNKLKNKELYLNNFCSKELYMEDIGGLLKDIFNESDLTQEEWNELQREFEKHSGKTLDDMKNEALHDAIVAWAKDGKNSNTDELTFITARDKLDVALHQLSYLLQDGVSDNYFCEQREKMVFTFFQVSEWMWLKNITRLELLSDLYKLALALVEEYKKIDMHEFIVDVCSQMLLVLELFGITEFHDATQYLVDTLNYHKELSTQE